MTRHHPWLTLSLLGILAITTQLWVWFTRGREPAREFVGPPRSDYSLMNFQMHVLNIEGALAFSVSAPRLTRRGDDGSINIDLPAYDIIDTQGAIWKGTSDNAWVNQDGSQLKLEGAVEMRREPNETMTGATIVTRDVIAWPKEQRMETPAAILITQPGYTLRSVGMKADLSLKNVELLSDVNARMENRYKDKK